MKVKQYRGEKGYRGVSYPGPRDDWGPHRRSWI